jgi:amino acid transporter
MEFWFAIIKVLTIISLIILGIILDAGGGPDHDVIGFRFWMNPGPFVQYLGIPGVTGRFLGYWAVLIQASFSYIGYVPFNYPCSESD